MSVKTPTYLNSIECSVLPVQAVANHCSTMPHMSVIFSIEFSTMICLDVLTCETPQFLELHVHENTHLALADINDTRTTHY